MCVNLVFKKRAVYRKRTMNWKHISETTLLYWSNVNNKMFTSSYTVNCCFFIFLLKFWNLLVLKVIKKRRTFYRHHNWWGNFLKWGNHSIVYFVILINVEFKKNHINRYLLYIFCLSIPIPKFKIWNKSNKNIRLTQKWFPTCGHHKAFT